MLSYTQITTNKYGGKNPPSNTHTHTHTHTHNNTPVNDALVVHVLERQQHLGRVVPRALLVERAQLLDPLEQLAVGGQAQHEVCVYDRESEFVCVCVSKKNETSTYKASRCLGMCSRGAQ